jgi:hypothetical protein
MFKEESMPATFDLHIHTNRHSPDSSIDPVQLLERARDIGLTGVVISEHDWLWTEEELEELRRQVAGVQVYAGIEVSAQEGHFLVYGATHPFRLRRGIGVAELCHEVHGQGGVIVAAHPFRWGQPFDEIVAELRPELDGLELMTSNMDAELRRRAVRMLEAEGQDRWCGLGSSDAHELSTVGYCYTEFTSPVQNLRDLVAAIRSRTGTPRESPRPI